jgi:ABC-type branched-chain amino acid transport systems, periplasmic component
MSGSTQKAGVSRRTFMKAAVGAGAASLAMPYYARYALANTGVVHIGASLPLTGTYEKVSRICRDGYDFFTKVYEGKMNVAGQLREVKLTIYDDENNASRSAQLTEKLISDDKVDLVLGTYGTDTILAQGSIMQKYGRVLLQSGAASRRVDEELGGHTAFTCINRTSTYGLGAMNYLAGLAERPKTMAVITMDDPVYHEIGQGVKDKAKELGIELVEDVVLPMNVQDLRPAALKLKAAGDVDVVYNTGWDLICIKLAQEMSALGVNPKAFIGGHLVTNPVVRETLGPKIQGVIGTSVWLPQFPYKDDKFASAKAFADRFNEQYGYIPTYHGAFTYILPWLYQEVLKDADPSDPFNQDFLRQGLAKYSNNDTIWGPVSFDEVGRIARDAAPAVQFVGDALEQKIIAPKEMAESEGVYPKPAW